MRKRITTSHREITHVASSSTQRSIFYARIATNTMITTQISITTICLKRLSQLLLSRRASTGQEAPILVLSQSVWNWRAMLRFKRVKNYTFHTGQCRTVSFSRSMALHLKTTSLIMWDERAYEWRCSSQRLKLHHFRMIHKSERFLGENWNSCSMIQSLMKLPSFSSFRRKNLTPWCSYTRPRRGKKQRVWIKRKVKMKARSH